MSDPYRDVGDFHRRFGLDAHPEAPPRLLGVDAFGFRFRFLEEELRELAEAHAAGDLAGAADALVDLVYVALGTAHLMGLDWNAHYAAVHAANMLKERASSAADPRSKRGHALDVVKPEGWAPPDHRQILERTKNDYRYINEGREP